MREVVFRVLAERPGHLEAQAAGWPRGTSPRGSHRSVRDALTSYGSCYPNIAATSDANGSTR